MKAALHRIFKKNLGLLILLLVVFIAAKMLTVYNTERYLTELSYLNGWVKDCLELDNAGIEGYTNDLAQKLSENKKLREKASSDFIELTTSYSNRTEMQQLAAFAQNGEGVLRSDLPPNYAQLLDFYGNLQTPTVINEQILDRYFSLQSVSAVPVIVLLLGAVLWGAYYESEVYRLSATTAGGRRYSNTMYVTLTALGVVIFAANELFDLWRSGLLDNGYIWDCSVQSYGNFFYTQMDATIGGVLGMAIVSKILGVLILSQVSMLLARWKGTVKDTVISSLLVLLIFFFFGKALVNTEHYSLVQLGMTDWKELIRRSIMLLPLRIDGFSLGVILTGVTEILLAGCCCIRKK